MELQELVEPSSSSWTAPVISAKKKNGYFRLCVDYRQLNDVREFYAYPIPDLNKKISKFGVLEFSEFSEFFTSGWGIGKCHYTKMRENTRISEHVEV